MSDNETDTTGDISERYRDNEGSWRWRRQSPNGKVVAASTEGYANEADAIANYWMVSGDNAPMLSRKAIEGGDSMGDEKETQETTTKETTQVPGEKTTTETTTEETTTEE